MQGCGDSDILTYGAIQIIPATHTVLLNGKPVHLAKMEYRLLGYLLQHQGEALPRQAILSAVWGAPPSLKTRTLDIHICALRRKLSLGRNLETVFMNISFVNAASRRSQASQENPDNQSTSIKTPL